MALASSTTTKRFSCVFYDSDGEASAVANLLERDLREEHNAVIFVDDGDGSEHDALIASLAANERSNIFRTKVTSVMREDEMAFFYEEPSN